MARTNEKQQAHDLIERLGPSQVSAVLRLLESITDPVRNSLADAPFDDEPVSEAEAREIAAARASFDKQLIWTDQARAHLRSIDQPTALRILHALAHFLETGEGNVKRLQNIEPPEFRLRVGDYRVRFHPAGQAIRITAVKHRREAYR